MKRALKDGWFQMCAAVAGLAAVVSLIGGTVSRHMAPDPAPASAPAAVDPFKAAQAQAPAAPAARAPAETLIVPPSAPVPASAPAPAPAPPPAPAPKMTLTGTGVGNAQGIAAGAGGGIARFFGIGGTPAQVAAVQPLPQARYVTPAKPGLFVVDAAGGGDTTSLRDAAYSAANGDKIRVKPGAYDGPVEIEGKSVVIAGEGRDPGAVTISHTGRSAAVVVRDGALDMEKIRVVYGQAMESPPAEPHGALYATGSNVTLRNVELGSGSLNAPPLIVEKGAKASRVTVEDSYFMGGRANVVIRGKVAAKFTRTRFNQPELAIVAWLDASVEIADGRFDSGKKINVYEGADAAVSGAQRPVVDRVRGAEATGIEQLFGPSRGAAARGRSGFSRDIFRAGRKPGQLP
ncbi:MAG: hypothetical protein HY923_06060 [Elusimicrobia bacterium]|nr:hypothetical protein [Elusimicrobiota bacterium]